VTVHAQNRQKLGSRSVWRSRVWAGGAKIQSTEQATLADWLTKARDNRCAEPSKSQSPSYVPIILVTDYGLDDRTSIPGIGKKDFPPHV
jgi:hypothetical protein